MLCYISSFRVIEWIDKVTYKLQMSCFFCMSASFQVSPLKLVISPDDATPMTIPCTTRHWRITKFRVNTVSHWLGESQSGGTLLGSFKRCLGPVSHKNVSLNHPESPAWQFSGQARIGLHLAPGMRHVCVCNLHYPQPTISSHNLQSCTHIHSKSLMTNGAHGFAVRLLSLNNLNSVTLTPGLNLWHFQSLLFAGLDWCLTIPCITFYKFSFV